MKFFLNKSLSMGRTIDLLTIFPSDSHVQLHHVVAYFLDSGSNVIGSLIGQISFVCNEKKFMRQFAKPIDAFVASQGLSDVIDLDAFILTARIRKKKNSTNADLLWGDINKSAIFCTPNRMEFGFYHHFGPFPNTPPEYLFSAMSSHILWEDSKTFVDWLITKGIHLDIKRLLMGNNGTAKLKNRGFDNRRCRHLFCFPPNEINNPPGQPARIKTKRGLFPVGLILLLCSGFPFVQKRMPLY